MKKLALLLLLFALPAQAFITEPDKSIIGVSNIISNSGAENGTAGWATFNNGASAVPTTMTGGSLTGHVTFTRTTGGVLKGNSSFLMTKAAANAQGDGWATEVNPLPFGYRGLTFTIQTQFIIDTGSVVQGDLGVWAYDETNGRLLTQADSNYWIVGSSGTLSTQVFTSTTTQAIRVGFYFASTSTAAATIRFDEFSMRPSTAVQGMAGSSDTPVTLTFDGVGTPAAQSSFCRRVGDHEHCHGKMTTGTNTAVALDIQLPSGLAIDYTKLKSGETEAVGYWNRTGTNSSAYANIGTGPLPIFADGSDTTHLYVAVAASNPNMTKAVASTFFSNGEGEDFDFNVPIAGWDANVVLASSSQFLISSALASGTRVTGSAPTALGQYRSYLRNASGHTYTETNGAPSAAPNVSDGIEIWAGNGFGSNDTNNHPSRYEIFVGKNKTVNVVSYASTGRTGYMNISPQQFDSTNTVGELISYDPTTGIVGIVNLVYGSTTGQNVGIDQGASTFSSGYFDVLISNNALSVGLDTHTVTSSGVNGMLDSAVIAEGASCTSSPCTITRQSPNGGNWISSVTRTGTGVYVVNFVTGYYSGAPNCTFSSGTYLISFGAATTSSALTLNTWSAPGSPVDTNNIAVMCHGPH